MKHNDDQTSLDGNPEFVAEFLRAQFAEEVCRQLAEKNLSKSDLAGLLGKSRQYVGRVINENANVSLQSIAEFACALKVKVDLVFHEQDEMIAIEPFRMAGEGSARIVELNAPSGDDRRRKNLH